MATYCSESSFSEDSLLESTVEIVQEEEPVSMDEMDARLEQEFGVDRFCTDALLDNVTESTPVIYYEEVVGGQFGGETHRDMFEYADGGESLQ
ncbi:hypothetical protein SAMN05443574_1248 [Haloarcula vallismortis]|uniref:Uncharacterized protein n=1 Tax=Haloarcula vallismortis TaxID=28442 RepID=A0A1H3AEU5_HALVA|nr:hypothetical protein SAMN05443574_1248 [Haloarcula vallismortis]